MQGLKGPTPATKEEKAAKGERRPSRVNYKEPELECAAIPEPPEDLAGRGLREWHRIIDIVCEHGILTEPDVPAFEDYCRAMTDLDELRTLRKQVDWLPAHEKGLIADILKVQDQVTKLRVTLGLTPAARRVVRSAKGAKKSSTQKQGAKYLSVLKSA